jgi:hypothetical protein
MNEKHCQGCGWKIIESHGVRRDHYCTVCDPNGKREWIASKAEGKERIDLRPVEEG